MVASYVFPHGATSPTTEATLILPSSPSSAAAIEKTKQRQQMQNDFAKCSIDDIVNFIREHDDDDNNDDDAADNVDDDNDSDDSDDDDNNW
ncbi:hypothetical protein WUBG_01278 [Wuchereria bancrofti]|uniref:Uncharacterized protein n=1 Tax=Wuchereria bancrofti TaxID=6293 RepID=J9FDX1_WUCBA|nr:hypothetical protein WUBG_01278 [Wuchereria bancrofti]